MAFQSIEGELKVVGIGGIAGINPTILMRTGDFAMELTVVNQDIVPHAFYIDGLNIATGLLEPGQSEVLVFYSEGKQRTTITTTRIDKSHLDKYGQSKS